MNKPDKKKVTIGVHTLGCRLNLYESDGILQSFQDDDTYQLVGFDEGPDIAIVNSCTVTDQADSRSKQILNKLRKKNAQARVIFTGCYAQTDPDKVKAIPDVDLVVGNDQKPYLKQLIEAKSDSISNQSYFPQAETKTSKGYGMRPHMSDPFAYGFVRPIGHTRAYIKIQDGCDRKCSYCKIPMARGQGVSRKATEILDHVRDLESRGIKEIVLTGVNLGWFRDRSVADHIKFYQLLEMILDNMQDSRLRLSSIEPCDVNAELAHISRHPRFCNFLHVPLQSGSSRILKAMRRTYSAESFLKRMETVFQINPDLFVGTDVIVGFPDESETDFQATLDVCQQTRMANIHAFRYSARAGTPIFHLGENIPRSVIKERMQRLAEVQDQNFAQYVEINKGRMLQGILEKIKTAQETSDNGAYAEVLTDNFLRIRLPFNQLGDARRGDLLEVKLLGPDSKGLLQGQRV